MHFHAILIKIVLVFTTFNYSEIILVGGDGPNEGLVELLFNASYSGGICSFGWSFRACSVACRYLNYRCCYDYERYATFGTGGPMVTDEVGCNGYENALSECTNGGGAGGLGIISESCYNRTQLAGVRCWNTTLDIRLVNGPSPNEGRVEISDKHGAWGAVCDYGWDIDDGTVACRQLGYSSAVEVYTGSYHGEGNPIVKSMKCVGSEAALSDCLHNGIGRPGNCLVSETASVRCSDDLQDTDISNDVISMVDSITSVLYPELDQLADGESKYFTMDDKADGVLIKSSNPTIDLTPITREANAIVFALESDTHTNESIGIIAAKLISVNVSIPFSSDLTNSEVVSDLVSVTVYVNGRNDTKNANVELVFPTIKISENTELTNMEPICSFLDETVNPVTWSKEGCATISEDFLTSPITCQCNHLTTFAILMQTSEDTSNIDEDAAVGLEVLSYAGLTISNGFLIFTMCIICLLSDLRKSRRYRMLRHLVISLLCTNFCFSFLSFNITNKVVCSIIAACLHYSLLVAFSWMAILSTDMYMCIQHAFGDPERRFVFFRIFGWAFPLLLVIITVSIGGKHYASESCWLNTSNGVTWTFIGPVIFTILIVTVQLSVVGYVAYTKSQSIQNDDDRTKLQQIRTLLYRILLLTPAVGLTWIFGIFQLFNNSIVLQYLFVFSSSFQGFFIWFTQCFLSKEVKSAWKKFKMQHMSNNVDTSSE